MDFGSLKNLFGRDWEMINWFELERQFPELENFISLRLEKAEWDGLLEVLILLQRLVDLSLVSQELRKKFSWSELNTIEFDEALKCNTEPRRNLSDLLVSSSLQHGGNGPVLVAFTLLGNDFAKRVKAALEDREVEYALLVKDGFWLDLIFEKLDVVSLEKISAEQVRMYNNFNQIVRIETFASRESSLSEAAKLNKSVYLEGLAPVKVRLRNGELFYTLTILPTPADAELDQMPYGDYLKLFFQSCDQPWKEIEQAQTLLIDKLNSAKILKFVNSDGTDLEMDIEGFTFANSVVAKNIPGAEVFSAPRRDSLNGKLVAKGRFYLEMIGEVIEDITFEFERGEIVKVDALKGAEVLRELIESEEGTRYIGEIGIGTNPHLRKHLINGLLVEKVSGSFHLALGNAYTYTNYCGTPVVLDNGNRSERGVHWDITTLLKGRDGKMILDGEVIQENGNFLDPNLDVLNYGWGVIEDAKQPTWWKEEFPNGYL